MLFYDISPSLSSSNHFNCYCNHKLFLSLPRSNIIENNLKRFFSISHFLSGTNQNYYQLLELSDNCSRKDIKKAFARLSKLVSNYYLSYLYSCAIGFEIFFLVSSRCRCLSSCSIWGSTPSVN